MAVIIRPKFTKAQIQELVAQKAGRMRDAILLNLQKIGEEFIITVRNNNTYKDRTGNLRSSTGYVILYNGEQIFGSDFTPVRATAESGPEKGRSVIEEIKAKYSKGFVLIGVAGMGYAAAVEARGYDVISFGSIKAALDLKASMQRLASKQ
jgi:hypothetical protein